MQGTKTNNPTFLVPRPWCCMAAKASPRVCSLPGAGIPGAQSGVLLESAREAAAA